MTYEGLKPPRSGSSQIVYPWPLLARHFIGWILPALLVYFILSVLFRVVIVKPSSDILQDYLRTDCTVLNNTRVKLDPSDQKSGWWIDSVQVRYNVSSSIINSPIHDGDLNGTSLERYSVILECKGSQNRECSYYHAVGSQLVCLYNPTNYSSVVSEVEAELNVETAMFIFRVLPLVNVLVGVVCLLILLLATPSCGRPRARQFFLAPASATFPTGKIHVEGIAEIKYEVYRTALLSVLEKQVADLDLEDGPSESQAKLFPTTKESFQINAVKPVGNTVSSTSRVGYILVVCYAFFVFIEWTGAILVMSLLSCLVFSVAGTAFFVGLWACVFICFDMNDHRTKGIDVLIDGDTTVRLRGGFLMKGMLGVEVVLDQNC